MSDPRDGHGVDVTRLLSLAASGRREHVDALMAAIYDDMRRLAVSHLRGERGQHTLQPTALVHEAYLKIVAQHSTAWQDRLHFFAVASRIIRRILVDHARARAALKRGGGADRLELDDVLSVAAGPTEDPVDLVALDEVLAELAELDETQARVVELRFFGGLSNIEIAELLSCSTRTVERAWRCAQTWLRWRLESESGGDGR